MMAYAAPGRAALGPIPAGTSVAYRHSEHPGWGGVMWQGRVVWVRADVPDDLEDLAPPTPAPATPKPQIIYVEPEPTPCILENNPNPPFVAQIDVYAGSRPLGIARGVSCESQAAAQANAESIAADMRATQKGATP